MTLRVSTYNLIVITKKYGMRDNMLTLSRQLRAGRVLVGWEQQALATAAGVSIGTVRRMEAGAGSIRGQAETLRRVQRALESVGVVFINHGAPGVQLRRHE